MAVLTKGQRAFARRLAQRTGLNPRLIGGWLLHEQSAGHARAREQQGNHNWLNIGYTDSGQRGTGNQFWRDPIRAADVTADWLQGRFNVPGFGRAAPGIRAFSRTAGQPLGKQIQALRDSGWATSRYPHLEQIIRENAGKFGIGRVAPNVLGATPGLGEAGDQLARRAARAASSTIRTKHRDFTPSREIVDKRRAIVDALLAGDSTAAASGRLGSGGDLLADIRRRLDSGAYTTVTPESMRTTIIEDPAPASIRRAARAALKGGRVNLRGGYAGTESVTKQLIDPIAKQFGISASNYKRDPARNAAVGGSPTSHHLTTNRNAYAADYPTTNGAPLAHRIARRLGIRNYRTGTYDHYPVQIGGRNFKVQILWGVRGHYDHVHFGIQAV